MEILDGMEATAILDELDSTLSLFYREKHITWGEMFSRHEFDSILEIAVRAGLQLYIRQKIKKYPGLLQRLVPRGLQTAVSIRKESAFETIETSEVDLSMLRLLLELGASPGCPPYSETTIWEDFLHEQVSH
jgi:hypothetical protein